MVAKVYKLSSFAKSSAGGNPAGVVLNANGFTEVQMQNLAKRIGYSETAFVSESETADFRLRFFTPNAEVDLCGHATIAAFSLMQQKKFIKQGTYAQETKAGVLKINIKASTVYMQQTLPRFYEKIAAEELADCLGIDYTGFDQRMPIQAVSTGIKDILVPVKSYNILECLIPDMKKIEEVSKRYKATGLHVFTLNDNSKSVAICRNFAPLYGIPEESATGTSNGALVCYLFKYGYLNTNHENIVIEQGSFMNKPSTIKAVLKLEDMNIEEIWVGGEALMIGEEAYEI
ncbi:MAG: PhzF family phenazine biosynthesis protein [Lutisporaceae bacterium]